MSHITFTYHMWTESEVAETCITLPMTAAAADAIMAYEPHQIKLGTIDRPVMQVYEILKSLSLLQDHIFSEVVTMERVD